MAESLGSEVGDHVIAKHYQKKSFAGWSYITDTVNLTEWTLGILYMRELVITNTAQYYTSKKVVISTKH